MPDYSTLLNSQQETSYHGSLSANDTFGKTRHTSKEQDALSSEEKDAANATETEDSTIDQEPEKRFEEWIQLKEKLHYGGKAPRIRQREVWWCSFGENVGVKDKGYVPIKC